MSEQLRIYRLEEELFGKVYHEYISNKQDRTKNINNLIYTIIYFLILLACLVLPLYFVGYIPAKYKYDNALITRCEIKDILKMEITECTYHVNCRTDSSGEGTECDTIREKCYKFTFDWEYETIYNKTYKLREEKYSGVSRGLNGSAVNCWYQRSNPTDVRFDDFSVDFYTFQFLTVSFTIILGLSIFYFLYEIYDIYSFNKKIDSIKKRNWFRFLPEKKANMAVFLLGKKDLESYFKNTIYDKNTLEIIYDFM